MKKYIFAVLFFIINISTSFSQSKLNNYSYVTVPEQFEFLKGKDRHQLNSLTKFLLNKYGFNAFFQSELPDGLAKCDGLRANVKRNSGFIYTKLIVILTDCNGKEIYRSIEGKSKIKDFKQSYHQALRRAFESMKKLDVNQKEISIVEEKKVPTEKNESNTEQSKEDSNSVGSSQKYIYKEYALIPKGKGFTIWKNNAIIGEAIPSSKKGYFVIKTSEFIGIGIQNDEYFSVERYEAKKPKLLPMVFKLTKN